MHRNLIGIALAAAIIVTQPGCRTASDPRVAELDRLFSGLHARGLFDGAVVVSQRGVRLFERGYGYADVKQQVPFTPDTAGDGGSLAKTLTAALVIQLHHEGILGLDDPAQKYLSELPYPDVTLRHLLSHTSGLALREYEYFDAFLPSGEVRTTEALVRILGEQKPPLSSTPGTRFEYSSLGFDLAALAAGRAAGESYVDLLRDRILRPLDMASVFARPGRLSDFPAPRTLGYRRDGDRLEVNDVFDLEGFHGGSNLYFSARDLAKWNEALLRPARLSRDVMRDLQRPAIVAGAPSGLTLGSWYHSGEGQAFWYSGHLQGFHSEALRDAKSGASIVYMSNNTMAPWLQKALVRAVLQVMAGEPAPSLSAPASVEVKRDERQIVGGRWVLPGGQEFTIEPTAERLEAAWRGVTYRIVQVSPHAFYVPGLDWMIGFSGREGEPPSMAYVSTNLWGEWARRAPLSPEG